MSEVSRRHHFVPKFLLRPWVIDFRGNAILQGYWWDPRAQQLRCKRRGMEAFCNLVDLLTLNSRHVRGDDIERLYFGPVDHAGAAARDRLLAEGSKGLTESERATSRV